MKYKVGDRVRIKSREWYEKNKNRAGDILCGGTFFIDDMVCYCGNIATIASVDRIYRLDIDNSEFEWSDEMFEDDEPQVSETLLRDIANVIKEHDMGVQVSEEDGKLIIEPLKIEKKDLPVDTPVMVADADNANNLFLRYYAGNGEVFCAGRHDDEIEGTCHYDIIIPWDKFDPKNLGESMKFNIVK